MRTPTWVTAHMCDPPPAGYPCQQAHRSGGSSSVSPRRDTEGIQHAQPPPHLPGPQRAPLITANTLLLAQLGLKNLLPSSSGGPREDTCLPFPSQAQCSQVVSSWLLPAPPTSTPQLPWVQPDTKSQGGVLALRADFSSERQQESTMKTARPLAMSADSPQA